MGTTYPDALAGTVRVYLVTPVLRVRYAVAVAEFLDQAEAAGNRHVAGSPVPSLAAPGPSPQAMSRPLLAGRRQLRNIRPRNAAAWATPEDK